MLPASILIVMLLLPLATAHAAGADDAGRGSDSPAADVRTGPFWRGLAAYKDGHYPEALISFRQSAAEGNPGAEFYIGLAYEHGQGVPQDYAAAAEWYGKAAEQGNAQGQYNLGSLHESGQGAGKDFVRAYMWFDVSSTSGKYFGVNRRESVAAKMTPQQIADARRLADECRQHEFKRCD